MQQIDARRLTWANFSSSYLLQGIPAVVPILGDPPVSIFLDAGAARLGMRTPIEPASPAPSSDIAAIEVTSIAYGKGTQLQVSTVSPELFREFYAFAMSVADKIQLEGLAPLAAISASLRAWRSLFAPVQVLAAEAQLGLIGELWFLRRLHSMYKNAAVQAWIGPMREQHDFRVGSLEFEVKSSTLEAHTHLINGLQQLVPSLERHLYVVSLEYGVAGPSQGENLPDAVQKTSDLLRGSTVEGTFEERLALAGYASRDRAHYETRWSLRTRARAIEVDAEFPRIVPATLTVLGAAAQRVLDVRYEVQLQGLGVEDGDPRFERMLRVGG